jgi:MFS family permease
LIVPGPASADAAQAAGATGPAPATVPFSRLLAIGGLVCAQSVPSAFIGFGLPSVYRAQGVDLAAIGVLALATMPAWFKWLWAPIVDRFGSDRWGHRKTWIAPCTVLGALLYALLAAIPASPATMALTMAVLIAANLVLNTQDIAVDAYIVESLPAGSEARGALASAVGTTLGGVIGGSVFVGFFDQLGWTTTMLLAAASLVLGTLPALLLREAPTRRATGPAPSLSPVPEIRRHLSHPATWAVLGIVFIVTLTIFLPFRIEGAFMVDKGLSFAEIGFLSGGAVVIGNLLGYAFAERLAARKGLRATFLVGACLSTFAGLLYVMAAAFEVSALQYAVVALVANTVICPTYIALHASRYAWCDRRRSATDYTLQSSVTGLAQSASGFTAGVLAGAIGWMAFYSIAAVLLVAGALAAYFAFSTIVRLIARRDAGEPPSGEPT